MKVQSAYPGDAANGGKAGVARLGSSRRRNRGASWQENDRRRNSAKRALFLERRPVFSFNFSRGLLLSISIVEAGVELRDRAIVSWNQQATSGEHA